MLASNINIDALLAHIRRYTKEHPVYSSELESYFECPGPQIRDAIRILRRQGHPIANSQKGYYYARTFEELEPTILDLQSRALSQLETIRMMKSHFFPSHDGQPNLFNQ